MPNPMSTLQIDTSVDASDPPLLGGRITLPCFTNEEQEAQILNISRHDVAGLHAWSITEELAVLRN